MRLQSVWRAVATFLCLSVFASESGLLRAGDRDGTFELRGDDGELTMTGTRREGKLDGLATYYEKGKPVRTLVFKAGTLTFDRPLTEIRAALARFAKEGKDETEKALARLKAFRYLTNVPFDDIVLDAEYVRCAVLGSKLNKELGRLEHFPKNPGWPEDEFKLAFRALSAGNLGFGNSTLSSAVDGWMDDSDKFNIKHLGHRRWCLDPMMVKVGFGRTGLFSVMHCQDRSRSKPPPFDFVAFPPEGPVPAGFFRPSYAWSLSVNPARFDVNKKATPAVYPLDAMGRKEKALDLEYTNFDDLPFGVANCLIFRPAKLSTAAGSRYLVEIEGLHPRGKKDSVLRYVVEFGG